MVRELEGPELPRLVIVVDLRGAADDAEIAASRASGLAIAALGGGVRVELATVENEGPVNGPTSLRYRVPFRIILRNKNAVPGANFARVSGTRTQVVLAIKRLLFGRAIA